MARTVNPEVHTVRKEAFVDAATRVMQSKGWEQVSVQDVLDQLEASRGAFYHYFDSKQALLEAVIERMVDAALGEIEPIVADPSLPAIPKLHRVFSTIGRWKTERKAMVLSLLTVWMSDDNAIVREKFRRGLVRRFVPTLAPIIEQGVGEGVFQVASSVEAARVFTLLLEGFQEVATELFLERQSGRIDPAEVERTVGQFTAAFERILGAAPGSIELMDRSVFQAWFG